MADVQDVVPNGCSEDRIMAVGVLSPNQDDPKFKPEIVTDAPAVIIMFCGSTEETVGESNVKTLSLVATIDETVNTAATLMPPVMLAAPDRHMSEDPVVQEVVRQLSTPSFAPIDAVGV